MKNDFNKNPYYDDFDERKNYLKLLFKPGLPVQARELNQIQSVLQNQIGTFADHVFKNGSKVSNCRTSIVNRNYVRLLDVYADSTEEVDVSQFDDTYRVVGEVTKVEGRFVKGTNKDAVDPATLFVIYDVTGEYNDEDVTEFLPGEPLPIVDKNGVVIKRVQVRCPGCPSSDLPDEISPLGTSAFFAIDEGVIYFNSYFIHVDRQEIVLIKYVQYDEAGIVVSQDKFKVGLDLVETIVTAEDDPNLYDISLGYANEAAPGADRYHLEFVLTKREYSAEDGDAFVLLAKVLAGLQVEFMKSDAEYGQLMEEFARRTYEQAGDFTVSPYKTKFYEAKKNATNGSHGWSDTGNEKDLVAVVSPAVSYVKGYRNETKSDTVVTFEKARDTEKVDNFSQYFANRPYVNVKPVTASHIVSPSNSANILSTTELQLYDGPVEGTAVSGNNIGFVKVIDQSIVATGEYKVYVYDVTITRQGSTFGQAKSCKTADGQFVASIVQTDGKAVLNDANNSSLLYPISKKFIKSLRDVENSENGDTTIFVRRKLIGRTDSMGRITFTAQTNESFLAFNPQDNIAYVGTATLPSAMVVLSSSSYITTGGTLTVDAGPSRANQEIVVYANIQKVSQMENTKIVNIKTFTPTTKPTGVIGEVFKLGVADAFQIKSVQLITEGGADPIDVTSDFELLDGQTDMFYTESSIRRIATRNIGTNQSLLISVYYFKHEGAAGFFTVDSYSQLLDEENEWELTYEDIPTYKTSSGTTIRLSDAFDFRPILMNGAISTTGSIPVLSTTAVFDVEFYLPRRDLLCINTKGDIYVKKGTPSLNPVPPVVDSDSMALYQIKLSAYTFDISGVSTKFIENKRWTMREIGNIAKRVDNLEYYSSLSMLEQSTVNMSVKDADGFDRYKNGYLVDSFTNYNASDITNEEFKATIDTNRGELRPVSVPNSTKLEIVVSKSTNVEMKGSMALIPYNEERFQENPYATKTLSINPYMS